MKKIIIPRRDHEVYFIPVPEPLGPKLFRSFVAEQMDRLHPGFSGETVLDIKRLLLDKSRWLMVTVMEAETLAEYRVLHKGAAFFTNTSISVKKKDFFPGGIKRIDDERIGWDSERKIPVSIPLESDPLEQDRTGGAERQPKSVKNVSAGCRVFAGRIPAWRVTTIIACAALLVPVPLFFFPAAKEAKETTGVPLAVTAPEVARKPKYPPAALEILAEMSAALAGTGGKITRWQYNESQDIEGSGPLVLIETRGIDASSARKIFSQYDYLVLEDIPDVRYIEGEPYLTVCLNPAGKGYAAHPAGTFFSQNFSFPIFSDLAGELKRHQISIVSETLPSAENGNALYTVTYTAKDLSLISSMEIITAICDKYPVRVKVLELSINGESNRFTVVCSLAQSDTPRYTMNGLGEEKAKIPRDTVTRAFGYREAQPPPAPPLPVKVAAVQAQEPRVEKPPEVSIVGTISDDRGQILFYREAGDNKIKIKDTP